jgi:hypothetical protein
VAWINRRNLNLHPTVPPLDFVFPNLQSLLPLLGKSSSPRIATDHVGKLRLAGMQNLLQTHARVGNQTSRKIRLRNSKIRGDSPVSVAEITT